MLRFELLGAVAVRDGEQALPIGPPLRRSLLALLLLHRGRTVSLARITEALWEDQPPARPEASVQAMMSHLRRVLEPARGQRGSAELLRTQLPGYQLVVPTDAEVDVDLFDRDLTDAAAALQRGDPARSRSLATAALQHWRGLPLTGLSEVAFVREAVAELEDRRARCQLLRCEAALELGEHELVIAELEALSRAHLFHERVWELLILALYRSGRMVDALDRYAQFTGRLADEMGLDPGVGLRTLQERILRQDTTLEAPVQPADPATGATAAEKPPAPPIAQPVAPIGRDSELVVLHECVSLLSAGRFSVLVLEGAAGIGKTTLAQAVAATASELGAAVGWGRCHEDVDTTALWPVLSGLDQLDVQRPQLAAGAGEISAAFPAIARSIAGRAGLQPLVLIVEDVHWADPATLRLLAFLAVELAAAPVLLVLSCRPDTTATSPASTNLRGLLATLSRQPALVRLQLAELDGEPARELARRVAGIDLSAADLELIVGRAGGNPFFLGEIARLVATGDRATLPSAVEAVVHRRLAGLPADTRRTLQAAAVLGARFDLQLLSAVTTDAAPGQISETVLELLEPALQLAVVNEIAGVAESLAFSHAVVRDAVLAGAGALARRRWHAKVAGALTAAPEQPGDPTARAVLLAHHLVEGQPLTDRTATVAALTAAGRANAAALAHDDAAYWYGRAVEAVGTASDSEQLLDLWVLYCRSLSRAGRLDDLGTAITGAFRLALAARDRQRLADLAEILDDSGGIWFWADFGTVPAALIELLEQALEVVGATPSAFRSRLLGTLGVGLYYSDDADRSTDLCRSAVRLAESIADESALVSALTQLVRVLWRPTSVQEQSAAADRLLAIIGVAARPGDSLDPGQLDPAWVHPALVALGARSAAYATLGRIIESEADLQAALDLALRHRLSAAAAQLYWQRVAVSIARGDLAGAVPLIKEAVDQQEHTQLYQREGLPLLSASEMARIRGELGHWQQLLAERRAMVGIPTAWLEVLSAFQGGRLDQAREIAQRAPDSAGWPPWLGWLACVCVQARAVADIEDEAACAWIAEALRPYSGRHAVWGSMLFLGPVDYYLGRVELVRGHRVEARRLLRSAVDQAQRAGLVAAAAEAAECLSTLLPVGSGSAAERRELLVAGTRWREEMRLAGS